MENVRILNEEDTKREEFLSQMFKNYYSSNFNKKNSPTNLEYREFGFFYWDLNKFVRHLGFLNFDSLLNHIISNVPKHIYCSAARYENPNAPNMYSKSFMDCDLIFDLDIDHIYTDCKEKHDKWKCKQCGHLGRGRAPRNCPKCNTFKFDVFTWECDECMKKAKDIIFLIIDEFLIKDFGLDPMKDLYIVFSGQRGYHIHIEKDIIRNLDINARRDVGDYISGKELIPLFQGFDKDAGKKPNINEIGWRGRIARFVIKFLQDSKGEDLRKILRIGKDIELVRKELIYQLISENPSWSYQGIGDQTWLKLIKTAAEKYGIVDQPVTIDIHRLIRLPGSLHGKTGFIVKKLTYTELETFDPFSDAQIFSGTKEIFIKETPQFRIGNEIFGPFKDKQIELPMNAAVFLLSKGLANL